MFETQVLCQTSRATRPIQGCLVCWVTYDPPNLWLNMWLNGRCLHHGHRNSCQARSKVLQVWQSCVWKWKSREPNGTRDIGTLVNDELMPYLLSANTMAIRGSWEVWYLHFSFRTWTIVFPHAIPSFDRLTVIIYLSLRWYLAFVNNKTHPLSLRHLSRSKVRLHENLRLGVTWPDKQRARLDEIRNFRLSAMMPTS